MSNILLENVEIWWPFLGSPRKSLYPEKPASWSVQLRTADSNAVKQWKKEGLSVKSHIADEKDPETYFYINLYKRSEKDGVKKEPPNVVDGRGHKMDGSIVGNASIAHVSLFGYDHPSPTGTKTSFVLMGVQVMKLVKYVGKKREPDFKDTGVETQVIGTSGGTDEAAPDIEEDDIPFEGANTTPVSAPQAPTSTGGANKPKIAPNPNDEF